MSNLNIGNLIREYRKKNKLTQKELAEKIDKAESTVRMWELGKNKPTPDVLRQLSTALNVSYSELMEKAGYTNESDKMEILQTQLLALEETKMHKKIKFDSVTHELSRSDLNDETRKHLKNVYEESYSELQKIDNAIASLTELIKSSDEYKEAKKAQNLIQSFAGKAETEVDLENLFNIAKEITIGGKILSPQEKEQALRILKATFYNDNK